MKNLNCGRIIEYFLVFLNLKCILSILHTHNIIKCGVEY